MTDSPTNPPPPERVPRPRKNVTQLPAAEVSGGRLRGPLVPQVPFDAPPLPPPRAKIPSGLDLDALVQLKLAEALAGSRKSDAPDHDKALGAAVRTILKQGAAIIAVAAATAVATILARPSADPAKVDAQATQIRTSDKAVTDLQADVAQLRRDLGDLQRFDSRWQPFELQLWNKLGVKVQLPSQYTAISVVTPQNWARIKQAPLFEVQTTPPMPPSAPKEAE